MDSAGLPIPSSESNRNQPQSTLLLLVAAAIGEDWEKLYRFTLEKNYRFLSYGDGSLLFLNSIQEMQLNAMPIQQKAN